LLVLLACFLALPWAPWNSFALVLEKPCIQMLLKIFAEDSKIADPFRTPSKGQLKAFVNAPAEAFNILWSLLESL
jgi:hypothetical protein